jgi:hypothetical protein
VNRSLLAAAVLSLALAVGCTDPFSAAQELDTIEAYEKFLAENPSSPQVTLAKIRLEELSLEKVRENPTLEGYDAFIQKFPDSMKLDDAKKERIEFLWKWADEQDTAEAWQQYLDQSEGQVDSKTRKKARRRKRMAENKDRITVGPVEQEQVNLAENADGPLDGWGFYAEVKNVGDEPISYLVLRIDYLDADGKTLDSDTQGACARYWNVPMPSEFYKPILPGETRKWEWTTGDMPVGWAKKVKLKPVDIVVGLEEEEEE